MAHVEGNVYIVGTQIKLLMPAQLILKNLSQGCMEVIYFSCNLFALPTNPGSLPYYTQDFLKYFNLRKSPSPYQAKTVVKGHLYPM